MLISADASAIKRYVFPKSITQHRYSSGADRTRTQTQTHLCFTASQSKRHLQATPVRRMSARSPSSDQTDATDLRSEQIIDATPAALTLHNQIPDVYYSRSPFKILYYAFYGTS